MFELRGLAPLGALYLLTACSSAARATSDAGSPPVAPDAGSPPVADAGGPISVPLEVESALGGKVLLAPVSVSGSAPVEVLLDTGSTGLRVFASALNGASVTTGAGLSVTFGSDQFVGREAKGVVAIGGATTPSPIAFQLVDSVSCPPGDASCDPATENQALFTKNGIDGVLGVGLRPPGSGDVYSPIAQLGLARAAFTVHTGGAASTSGSLVLGAGGSGFETVALSQEGTLPNGVRAWGDDQVQVCFRIGGTPNAPPCTPSVFDTGSNADVVYAPSLPASDLALDGTLAPGVAFEASCGSALDVRFTVGDPPESGIDLVWVDSSDDFSILGIEAFFRYDVRFDLEQGRIGFRPR